MQSLQLIIPKTRLEVLRCSTGTRGAMDGTGQTGPLCGLDVRSDRCSIGPQNPRDRKIG